MSHAPRSRAIVVIAPPRTGSSALAGCLHRLGVNMGDDLQPADVLNKKGYYEDRRWQILNKEIAGFAYEVRDPQAITEAQENAYRKVIDYYNENYAIWGFKNPRACFTLKFIWPLLDEVDVRVIYQLRDFDHAVASLHRHSQIAYGGQHKMTLEAARSLQEIWHRAASARYEEAAQRYPVAACHFEALMAEPAFTLERLAKFCFDSMPLPGPTRQAAALGFVSGELVTFA